MKTLLVLAAVALLALVFKNRPQIAVDKASPPVEVTALKRKEIKAQTQILKQTLSKPNSVKSAGTVSGPGPSRAEIEYSIELSRWIIEANSRSRAADERIQPRLLDDGTLLFEEITHEQKIISQTDKNGLPLADEIQFADGRKFSKLYHRNGQLKALYFEKSKQFAFSVSFNEHGRQLDFTRSVNGAKISYRLP